MTTGQVQDHDQKNFSAILQFPMENIWAFHGTETTLKGIRTDMVCSGCSLIQLHLMENVLITYKSYEI